jgi:hypothetical protein
MIKYDRHPMVNTPAEAAKSWIFGQRDYKSAKKSSKGGEEQLEGLEKVPASKETAATPF